MMAFLWDQEIGGAHASSVCSGQEVLGYKEELGERVDAQGQRVVVKVHSNSEKSISHGTYPCCLLSGSGG